MALRFRPYPGLTVAAAIMVAILVGLGLWQLQRLKWKEALIATVNGHMAAAPVPLNAAMAMSAEEVQYRKVSLAGTFDNAREAYVFTTGEGGTPVYHVLTPFITDDDKVMMVDRGEIPAEKLSPATRTPVNGRAHVVGVWRVPDAPGWFTPKPDPARHIWYARDLAGMAAAEGIHLAALAVLEADNTPNPGGWPKGGETVVDFPNNHLQYAITWFGLAAGLLGVYAAYHVSKGRISWS